MQQLQGCLAMKAQVENRALNDVEILENNAKTSACEGGVMSEMDGLCMIATRLLSQWSSHSTTLSSRMSRRREEIGNG